MEGFEAFEYMLIRVMIAGLFGSAIGFERGLAGKDASLRTFSLISIGSCVYTLLSSNSTTELGGPEPSRIAAQVVSGVGFLGAGVIFRSPGGVRGLTTAALIWVTAAVGMAVGFNRIDLALAGTSVSIAWLLILRIVYRLFSYDRDLGEEEIS